MSQLQPGRDEPQKDLEIVTLCMQCPSKRAWTEFFRQFEPRLRLWIRSALHDSPEAEIEDAYSVLAAELIAGKTLRTFDVRGEPAPYLNSCARHVALGIRRRRLRKRELSFDDETVPLKQLQLLADQAEPESESEIVKRLIVGIKSSVRQQKRLEIFLTLLDEVLAEQTFEQMVEKTRLSPSSVYRYLADVKKLSYRVLGVPYPR